ncbi:hypothetical protein Ancab_001996 [Ancistrocladus abbreviatus]
MFGISLSDYEQLIQLPFEGKGVLELGCGGGSIYSVAYQSVDLVATDSDVKASLHQTSSTTTFTSYFSSPYLDKLLVRTLDWVNADLLNNIKKLNDKV